MRPKLIALFFLSIFAAFTAEAALPFNTPTIDRNSSTYVNDNISALVNGNTEALLKLTPKQVEKMTGKKLTLKETLKLKAAQKMAKKAMKGGGEGMSKGLFILLALLGWAWLAMAIKDDWSGNTWWTNLILTALCGLPGFIHALVKMKNYTK
jgi:hypothetical protein